MNCLFISLITLSWHIVLSQLTVHLCKCSLFLLIDVLMGMKEGVIVVFQPTNGSRGEGKAGLCGFIYPLLIKQL